MIKKCICLMLSIFMIFSFTGCSKQESVKNDYPVVVNDVSFEKSPEKVIVMSDSIADIVIALGYDTKLCACTEDCSQKEIYVLPRIPKDITEALAKIKEFSPDLILADDTMNNEDINALKSLGVNTLVFSKAKNRNELINLYNDIGAVLGGDKTGRKNADKISNNILMSLDDINRLIPQKDVNTIACYIYGDSKIATGDNFISEIIKSSGAINIAQGSTDNHMEIKDIKISNPDYIFCDNEEQKEKIKSTPDFENINAVKNDKIFVVKNNLMERQGNSIVDSAVYIAGIMYPELAVKGNEQKAEQESLDDNEDSETSDDTNQTDNNLEKDVMAIESRLDSLDYMPTKPDGIFNDNTIRAITDFQFINGMETTGKLDSKTIEALFSDSAIKRPDPAREK